MIQRVLGAVATSAVLLSIGTSASGQTVEALIDRNLEAKGGLDRIRAVHSIRITSDISAQGMVARMTIYSKRPNLMRQEIAIGGQTMVNAFDGQTPWMINRAATGSDDPIPVTGPQAESMRTEAAFDGPLVDYAERGMTAELVGTEVVDDRSMHHLKMTSKEGQVQHVYLDAETGLESRIVTEGAAGRSEQRLSDYRTFEGMTIPYQITVLQGGTVVAEMSVATVEFNPTLDDALFRMGGHR